MNFFIFYIPFPIILLLVIGLIFTAYKIYISQSNKEKINHLLKFCIYILYFLIVSSVLFLPFTFNSIYPAFAFFSIVLLFGILEIYKIRKHLNFKVFLILLLIFIGSFLNFFYWHGYNKLNIFYCIFIFDGMSQIGGQLLGKHKLAPKISPNKTWEGFIIGLLTAIAAMWFIDYNSVFLKENKYYDLLFYTFICILGLLGDLFFSNLKRKAGIKDFGNYIPGHGGVLDRFDSLLFTYAIIFYIFTINLIITLCTSDGPFLTF